MVSRANRILAVAVTWFVIVFGCYLSTLSGWKWHQLQPLPERASAIALTCRGYVLATAENGNTYQMDMFQEDEAWTVYDEASEEFYVETCEADDCNRFKIPPPPGEVIARSRVDCAASAESRFFADVALLENGEVWMVMIEYSGIVEGFQSLFYIAAGSLGVILLLIGGALKLYDGE